MSERFPVWQVQFCPFCGVSILGCHQGNAVIRCAACSVQFTVVKAVSFSGSHPISGSLESRLEDLTITPSEHDGQLQQTEGPEMGILDSCGLPPTGAMFEGLEAFMKEKP